MIVPIEKQIRREINIIKSINIYLVLETSSTFPFVWAGEEAALGALRRTSARMPPRTHSSLRVAHIA